MEKTCYRISSKRLFPHMNITLKALSSILFHVNCTYTLMLAHLRISFHSLEVSEKKKTNLNLSKQQQQRVYFTRTFSSTHFINKKKA